MNAHVLLRDRTASVPLLALALGSVACHGSSEGHHAAPPIPVYLEIEQNDDAYSANDFGLLAPGAHLRIDGSVRDDGFDPQDGFAFTAQGAIAVEFTLDAHCACADLDVWIYDPLRDEFVGVFDSPYDPEHGSITVFGQAFHLVVVSAAGDAAYSLDVRTSYVFAATGEIGGEGAERSGGLIVERASTRGTSAVGRETVVAAATDVLPPLGADLERYRASARRTGAPRRIEVFVIDPDEGVVATAWVPLEP